VAKRLDELDYYALLGVAPDASVDAIKAAFRAFARRYHPDRHVGDPEVVAKVTRIYRRATEAYRVLTHFEQRRAYDVQLAQGQLRLDPEQVRASVRPSVAPGHAEARGARARPFVIKAEQAMRERDYKQAKLNFQIALMHEPANESLKQKLAEVDALLKPG
jgi:curved DNA-binding protein CbpA